MLVSLVEETRVHGGNHAATKSNGGHFHTYDPCPVPVLNQVYSITSPPSTWGKLSGGTINYGIPQGSVLGPLIYLLYVNDITGCDIKSDLNMFADDTPIVAHGKVLADVISQINNDVAKLTDWFNSNKLTVNLDKTRCMYYRKMHMMIVNNQ